MSEIKQKQLRFLIAAVLMTFGGLFLSACESADPNEASIPWARPASWEGNAPGMGAGGFNAGRTGY